MAKPNLFIVGAGKSGTTSLYHLLKNHPEIKVSDVKEPSFFCSYFQVVKNPIEYFKLFDPPKKYCVDASHVYFSNPETAPVLKSLFPDAKFLVILRQPKARAYSLYQHMRRAMHADGRPLDLVETFPEALRLEGERFVSAEFFEKCRQYFWNFMYMRSSCYDIQLQRYLDLYDRDRFLVTSLAEFKGDPVNAVQAIGRFLDVDAAGFGGEIPVTNVAPPYSPCDPESDAFMDEYFGDLTARVDRLVGRPLDWSL